MQIRDIISEAWSDPDTAAWVKAAIDLAEDTEDYFCKLSKLERLGPSGFSPEVVGEAYRLVHQRVIAYRASRGVAQP